MKPFDWKRKFDAAFTMIDSSDGFNRYHIKNVTGDGTITECALSHGLQAIKIDLHMGWCQNLLPLDKNVIEMNYCLDGRLECKVNNRYCYMVSAGNFSICYAGSKETHGEFPSKRYQGTSIFLDAKLFKQHHAEALRELNIHMEKINALASLSPRCFLLHRPTELMTIQTAIADGFKVRNIPRLRLKVMELLFFLSHLGNTAVRDTPVYLNKSHVTLTGAAHKMLTADLSKHLTIEYLAAALGVGTTALKRSFKSVYGMPIYQYQKELRLQKARQLLRETTFSVSVIAAYIGYANSAKFSSAFKKRFGVSPTEYKRTIEKNLD